jgi:hypothetical protein
MQPEKKNASSSPSALPNGPGAAALLSAGIGACALAIIAIAADRFKGFAHGMTLWKPTGPLSGVTTTAVLVWLIVWGILELRWRNRNLRMNLVSVVALVLLLAGFLLTFPPLADVL